MKNPNTGMTQKELIEFLRVVIAGFDKMNRRQRWQMRRDLKEYSRLVNIRYPFGKPAEAPKPKVAAAETASEESGC